MTKFKTKHKAHALKKTGAAALITAAVLTLALLFTACPNNAGGNAGNSGGGNSGGGGTSTPNHAVTFSVDGGNGTLTAKVGGSEISSGAEVEQGKIVEFSAMPNGPQYTVDSWSITGGSFEAGTGTNGKPIAKVKVVQPVSVTVKFKRKPGPPPMPTYYSVTFGVDGGNGTLTAMVGSTEITSGNFVEQGKTVTFTAQADPNYAVEKWTNNGTPIAAAGTNATYNHTVTAAANIKVKFKTAPVDVYVTGTSGGKAYVWKNNTPTELRSHETGPGVTLCPYAVRSQGNDVYIAGEENVSGVSRPLVWEKNGSLLWIGTNRWSYAYDIAFYKEKTLVAGKTYDGTDSGASITDISDPGNPVVTFLYKKTPPINNAEALALYAATDKLYAAGFKEDGNTYKKTVFLWTKPDTGTVSELELGLEGNGTYTNNIPYGLCTAGSSVYVAAGNLWKVEGGAVTLIPVADAHALYALCVHDGTVYAAGWTNAYKAAVWKIEGTNVSLYKELSTDYSGVYALCVGRDDLHAAGFYRDTDNKHKAVWWRIAADGTLTENKLGTAEGEARGICVAPQE